MLKYDVAFQVPEDVSRYVVSIREKYGFRRLRMEPHITLVRPFFPSWPERELVLRLNKVVVPKIKIVLDGFGFFEDKQLIFIKVVSSPEIEELWVQLGNLLGDELIQRSLHLTVAKHLEPELFNKLKPEFEKMKYYREFAVGGFALYSYPHKEGEWVRVVD